MATLTGQHLIDQRFSDRLWCQQRVEGGVVGPEIAGHKRLGEPLRNEHRPHAGRSVPRHQLCGETLVEGNGGRFAGRVADHVGGGHQPRHRGNRHHHAVVARYHSGQKLARQPVVRQRVDLEGQPGLGLGALQHRVGLQDARVVDQHRELSAQVRSNLGGGGCDGLGVGNVALVEAGSVRQIISRFLDVEDGDLWFDSCCQQEHDMLADAIAATRHDNDFARPVIPVRNAVVDGSPTQPRIEDAEQPRTSKTRSA
ncbi:hypothetical protein VTN77DRAFT_2523 [Rasamsonia byssochlamydoides]|uniref:uncharacterized protein n=1 Tax=Rasamsonia byssochlamydoides TaxID=89139 RepID=UPI003742469C